MSHPSTPRTPGHVLLVESWVGAMSALLPRGIRDNGLRFSFVTRDVHHYLRASPTPGAHPLLAAENVLIRETNDPETLADQLAALAPTLGFDGVLSSCDYYLPTVARVAERLGLPSAPGEAVLRSCRKDLTRRTLREAGLPGPAFAIASSPSGVDEAAAVLGFPLVFKPVDLCAGMYVRLVRDAAELRTAFDELAAFPVNARGQRRSPDVLLEEVLTGPEVSVESVTRNGTTTVLGITDKSLTGPPCFVETGHMFPAALDESTHAEITDMAVAAIQGLGLDNVVCHTELKLTPAGPRLVEVNPRPAGNRITELVRHVTGIDLPGVAAQVAVGREPDLRVRDTGVGSAAISFLLPPQEGAIGAINGVDRLADAEGVADHVFKEPGHVAGAATSNNHYLGHVVVTDAQPGRARQRAESLIAGLDVCYVDAVAA